MQFSNKKSTNSFEQKFTEGYNRGFELNSKIPLHLSEHTQYVLHAMREHKPKDVILNGICSGFTFALQIEKQKRLEQIKAIEKTQSKSPTKER
jgi:hypothetical protein